MIKERKNIDILLPTHFLAGVNIYGLYLFGDIIWEAHENFQKRSIRNRCLIKTAKGTQQISVPLKSGKNQQLGIKEVEIAYDENWVKELEHSLITNYSSSPYLEYYQNKILKCFSKNPKFLWDLNLELNELIIDLLDIDSEMKLTKTWERECNSNRLDYRDKVPDFDVNYQYPQLFKEKDQAFISNLSVLDLLFCCGPESKLHLKNIAKQIIAKDNMILNL